MKFNKVLVPLDGSEVAEVILPFIEQIAGPLEMEIVLLHVIQPIPVDALAFGQEDANPVVRELDALGYLEPWVERLKAKGIWAHARVRFGFPPTEIVEAAKAVRADLIAMTTHGRTGLGRLLFGSVAEKVLRTAPVPVFLMRMTEAALKRASAEAQPA